MIFGLEGLIKLYVHMMIIHRDTIIANDNKNHYLRYDLIPEIFENREKLQQLLDSFNRHMHYKEAYCFVHN